MAVILGSALAGCTPAKKSDKSQSVTISAGAIADSNLPDEKKSEELAKAAEQLLTAQGFVEAQDVMNLSLKHNPKNFRALFIQALLGPIMIFKGIALRAAPVAQKFPTYKATYDLRLSELHAQPDSVVKSFALDGKADLRTEKDLQELMDLLTDKLEELRLFAKENKDRELTIKAPSAFLPTLAQRYARACKVTTTAKYEYELQCPDPLTRYQVTLNRADFESIQYVAAAYEIGAIYHNSYNVDGVIEIGQLNIGKTTFKPQAFIDELLKNPNFGRLRDRSRMKQVQDWSLDMVEGMRWIIANQSTICPNGVEHPRNRVGKWVNKGICLPAMVSPYVDQLEAGIRGPVDNSSYPDDGTVVTARVDNLALFKNPVSDIRSLGLKIDNCNSVVGSADPTLGGTFPNRDANSILPIAASTCRK